MPDFYEFCSFWLDLAKFADRDVNWVAGEKKLKDCEKETGGIGLLFREPILPINPE